MNYSTSRVLRWRTHIELDAILFGIPTGLHENRMERHHRLDRAYSVRPDPPADGAEDSGNDREDDG